MLRITVRAASFASVLALAACGGEPSEDDIRGAMQASIDEANAQAAALVGNTAIAKEMAKSMTAKLDGVRKHGCAKDGAGYKCDVTLTMSGGLLGNQSGTTSLRLTKGEKGWIIVQ